ncbi:hypothetical protein MBLNU230_g2856t1 [Neophaeotheca triangularis]
MAKYKGGGKPAQSKKPQLTHFLCLPLVNQKSRPQLEASFQRFKDDVVAKPPGTSIANKDHDDEAQPATTVTTKVHPKAIRPIGALHCTLGVMSLNESQLKEAIDCLDALDVSKLLNDAASSNNKDAESYEKRGTEDPIELTLRGLETMHAAEKTSILYTAPSDPSERLRPFCLAVQDIFRSKGLLIPDDRPLKLHATIVNTIYAKGNARRHPKRVAESAKPEAAPPGDTTAQASTSDAAPGSADDRSQGHGPNANAPLKMNATGLLQAYQKFAWAEHVVLDRIAICEMGTKKKYDEEGRIVGEEYKEVATMKLPT